MRAGEGLNIRYEVNDPQGCTADPQTFVKSVQVVCGQNQGKTRRVTPNDIS